jgi:hypothetical protein
MMLGYIYIYLMSFCIGSPLLSPSLANDQDSGSSIDFDLSFMIWHLLHHINRCFFHIYVPSCLLDVAVGLYLKKN